MLQEIRDLYELEMLWTLGPEYDDQFHRITQYQATVANPVLPTEEELEELQRDMPVDEGYSVVIENESPLELSDDKRI